MILIPFPKEVFVKLAPLLNSASSPSLSSAHSLMPQNPPNGGVDLAPQRLRSIRKHSELCVQRREPLVEQSVVLHASRATGVAARVEAPAVRLDLRDRRDLAETGHIFIYALREMLGHQVL